MTKKRIKWLCPLLCLLLTALSGCGGILDFARVAGQSARAVEAAGGLSFDAVLSGKIMYRGVPLALDAVGVGEWSQSPAALRLQMDAGVSDVFFLAGELLLVPEGEELCAYLGLRPDEETVWIRLPLSAASPSALNPSDFLGFLTEGGEEDDCLHLRIPGNLIAEGAEDLPLTLRLDKETLLPAWLKTDLTSAAQTLLARSDHTTLRELSVQNLTLELAFKEPGEDPMYQAFTADGKIWAA